MSVAVIVRPAVLEDCGAITALIRELAVFEKAEHEMSVSAEELESHLFGKKTFAEALVAVSDGTTVGTAVFYEKYSTWKGPALHLEDLVVSGAHRNMGIGAALLDEVICIARKRGYGRVYWQVLDWNEDAVRFYQRFGARFESEWLNVHVETNDRKHLK